ncbi:MAG: PQQ-binding-like beta-propeller repeat protein [Chloroflexia bacterium]|nr:PQQ-binding-like beta-propeller repeat protein [Chloroflexia bacterium]
MWQRPINVDTITTAFSIIPLLIDNNKVLFSKSLLGDGEDTLRMYNSKTGALLWEWSDYIIKDGFNLMQEKTFYKNGQIFCNTGSQVYCIDANSGRTVWRTKLDYPTITGSPRMTLIGDYLYHFENKPFQVWNLYSTLRRKNIYHGDWEPVFTINETEDHYCPDLELPSLWMNPNGDSVLVFQSRYVQRTTVQTRSDLIIYNLSKKKIEFRLDNIDKDGAAGVKPPAIIGNNCYFYGVWSLFCIDLVGKKLAWTKQYAQPKGENFADPFPALVINNKLLVKPDNGALYQLNPETGEQLNYTTGLGPGATFPAEYKGLLYYGAQGNSKLYAMDPISGKAVWSEYSPNRYPNKFNGNRRFSRNNVGTGGVALDPINGYLYCSDYNFVMCLKIPE